MPLQLQGILIPRSGLAAKQKLRLFFAPCLIDHDYRGEIHAMLENQSEDTVRWSMGERICQIGYVPMYMGPVQEVAELSETERGSGGFGSTGRH
jgi:dUTP pyrophosphatase